MRYLFSFFSILILSGCTNAPDFNDVPELTYIGVQNNLLAQSTARDTVLIQVSITDAQGDIGGTDAPAAVLIDEYDGFEAATFQLPQMAKQGSGNGIKADITLYHIVVRGGLCCRYPDSTGGCIPSTTYPLDSIFYSLHVVDQAGNESNRVRVGPVYLQCD